MRKFLYSNMFYRNMISDLFGRSSGSETPGLFTPYFQYSIGPYQSDFSLYFPKEPYGRRYKNEIFNKLNGYNGADIADYLEFHFTRYPDKQAFLKFLEYETYSRLDQRVSATRKQKLRFTKEWVQEKRQEIRVQQQVEMRQNIEQGIREVLPLNNNVNQANLDESIMEFTQKLAFRIDQIVAGTEERMQSITDSFVTGNIELNNQNHQDKLIKLFRLLKNVQAPTEIAKGEQLFKRFSDTDVAAILRLHFETFKSKQPNTIQVAIKRADESIRDTHPKVKNLEKALQEYFY
ncbi:MULTISPECIES: hypothetical protein [Niastella]|uniref:Uncharacterized protein n=1 Tax=Niastella soli TaxID=2821487 RepID=A0ABS3YNS6_9BACT|nr:hypothetical protein [Niastella soli]MBO9199538.1 hypothetical protein [Niastella soli]